jgi:hypothetical protein
MYSLHIFLTNLLCAPPFYSMHATCPAHPNITCWRVQSYFLHLGPCSQTAWACDLQQQQTTNLTGFISYAHLEEEVWLTPETSTVIFLNYCCLCPRVEPCPRSACKPVLPTVCEASFSSAAPLRIGKTWHGNLPSDCSHPDQYTSPVNEDTHRIIDLLQFWWNHWVTPGTQKKCKPHLMKSRST